MSMITTIGKLSANEGTLSKLLLMRAFNSLQGQELSLRAKQSNLVLLLYVKLLLRPPRRTPRNAL